ncbi:MAG: hypothetical protein J3Q66DRAFT_329548 [Benniella sp.]|nr:MAG: hypothetical protein J3Q66DRAFT_329548 [Benniella sp.]
MSNYGLPEEPSWDDVAGFYDDLVAMKTRDLNMLRIGSYSRWARQVMNEERCRRKDQDCADTRPSRQERERIIAVGAPYEDEDEDEEEEDDALPEEPSWDDVRNFYHDLVAMDTWDLNGLPIGEYPKWARKVMNEERCRRKDQDGANSRPSRQERERIIDMAGPYVVEDEDALPEDPSWDDVCNFYNELVAMDTWDLNGLPIGQYPRWARKVMHEERCRRKDQDGANTRPSKRERERIIAIGTS